MKNVKIRNSSSNSFFVKIFNRTVDNVLEESVHLIMFWSLSGSRSGCVVAGSGW